MKKVLCGAELDKMPNYAFRIMSFMFGVVDLIKSNDNKLVPFNMKKGQTVIDYGSGTGRYLPKASEFVGDNGQVYAVDIHQLAIDSAYKRIKKYKLKNVKPVLTDGTTVDLPSSLADIIYALDMFHMVKDPGSLLVELNRLIKPNGILYLEDGHQARSSTREKVLKSGCWIIIKETSSCIQCTPKTL